MRTDPDPMPQSNAAIPVCSLIFQDQEDAIIYNFASRGNLNVHFPLPPEPLEPWGARTKTPGSALYCEATLIRHTS